MAEAEFEPQLEWVRQSLSAVPTLTPECTRREPGRVPSAAVAPNAVLPLLDLEITGVLGEGGMGVVSLARQKAPTREVAVKSLRLGRADPAAAHRLLEEGQITGALEHPGIVPVYQLSRDADGRPAIVMKRVAGVTWRELIRESEHPAWGKLVGPGADRLVWQLGVLSQVANAVHFANSRGVVHRDLKPANVMIGDFGEVYVLDWGVALRVEPALAEHDHSPHPVGTPAYFAPEMLAGSGPLITVRTDVYLLGGLLHEVLTGRPPHRGPSLDAALRSARDSDPYPYPPEVPLELAAICHRAMQKEPLSRYASAQDFGRAVAEYLTHRGSLRLAEEAWRRLEALRGPSGAARDPVERQRMFGECSFGFRQALVGWPGNARATEGLQAALEWMIEQELAARNPRSVSALLAELPERREELEAARRGLDIELERESAEVARLKAIADQHDVRAMSRQRMVSALAAGASSAAALLAFASLDRLGILRLTVPRATLAFLAQFAAFGVVTTVRRRTMFATPVNRIIVAANALAFGGVIIGLFAAWALDLPLSALTLTLFPSLFISSGMLALTVHRGLAPGPVVAAAGAAAAVLRPDLLLEITAVAVFLFYCVAARAWATLSRESPR
jgi:serine/threonine-protein kinase